VDVLGPEPIDTRRLLPVDVGDGLVLHATTSRDATEAYAVVDAERDRLREWLPWVDATTSVGIERDFLMSLEHVNAAGVGLHTTLRHEGEFAGFAGLRIDLMHRSAEVGYWIADRAMGKGLMLRAVAGLFDVGFRDLDLHRMELLAAVDNTRSRAIAERLGMAFEGVRREAEELASGFVDLAMYAVLAQDWPGAQAALTRTAQTGL
jgi:RimJ/RimL family protein N-acetyltransferase